MSAAVTTLSTEQPWPGTVAYTEADRPYFHGRKRESEELQHLLDRDVITLVYGPASVGKTSVVQAGLLPALSLEKWLPVVASLDWTAPAVKPVPAEDPDPSEPTTVPLDRPLSRQLLNSLQAAAEQQGLASPLLAEGDSLWEYFHRAGNRWWSARQQVITPVLILDNFEAVFTAARTNATTLRHAESFLEELSQLAANRPPSRVSLRLEQSEESDTAFDFDPVPVRIVLVMREEYVGMLAELRDQFPTLSRSRLRIAPFTKVQTRDALMRSSLQGNLFADGALDATVAQLADSASSGEYISPASVSALGAALAAERAKRGASTITEDFLAPRPAAPTPAIAPTSAPLASVAVVSDQDLRNRLNVAERRGRYSQLAAMAASFVAICSIGAALVIGVSRHDSNHLSADLDTSGTYPAPAVPAATKAEPPVPSPEQSPVADAPNGTPGRETTTIIVADPKPPAVEGLAQPPQNPERSSPAQTTPTEPASKPANSTTPNPDAAREEAELAEIQRQINESAAQKEEEEKKREFIRRQEHPREPAARKEVADPPRPAVRRPPATPPSTTDRATPERTNRSRQGSFVGG